VISIYSILCPLTLFRPVAGHPRFHCFFASLGTDSFAVLSGCLGFCEITLFQGKGQRSCFIPAGRQLENTIADVITPLSAPFRASNDPQRVARAAKMGPFVRKTGALLGPTPGQHSSKLPQQCWPLFRFFSRRGCR